jgi:beta-barrel assembly-enhancing protease
MQVNRIWNFCFVIFCFGFNFCHSQVNFDDYSPVRSIGQIPEDFLIRSYKKIESDRLENRTSLKKKQEKIFLEGIHYSIDQLLHSGAVIFGDPITEYINQVADKLLSSNQQLRSKLRFYTLKSNAVNAFSTDQGIVVVTTGLFSRLQNEAQLAFVLAHEISHYTEKHVINSFDYAMNVANKDVYKLSAYSQDHELEADALGLKMYLDAGYSKDAIDSVFDLLMHAHLPFEEKEIHRSIFSFGDFEIPESRFPKTSYPILKDEDYDDELSSHPNIGKRKNNIVKILGGLGVVSEGVLSFFDQSKFAELVKISIFESVRIDVVNGNFVNAINTIFLLESKGNSSIYLNRMKAASWLGISVLKQNGQLSKYLKPKKQYEGTVSKLHEFLQGENAEAINALSIRVILDVKQKHPMDEFIRSVWDQKIQHLAGVKQFDLNGFETVSVNDALEKVQHLTGKELEKAQNKILSNYYKYGMTDVFSTDEFKKDFEIAQLKVKSALKAERDQLMMSKKERKQYERELLNFGLTDLIMLEPHVVSYSKRGVKLVKSEKLSESFSESIQYCEDQLGMQIGLISSKSLSGPSVDEFNEHAVLFSYLTQLMASEGSLSTSVDKEEINKLRTKYKTSKLLLTNVEHYYKPNLNIIHYGITFAWPPMGFVLIPIGLMNGNNTTVNYILLDLEQEKILAYGKKDYHDPVTPKTMKAFVFDIMSQLNSTKK